METLAGLALGGAVLGLAAALLVALRRIGATAAQHGRVRRELEDLNASLEARIREGTAELERAQAQLLQAQKMEAIGRLAGGIAHDFNNLLQVITGFGEVAQQHLSPGSPPHDAVNHILEAGEKASGLTRQLLAFSRRQVLQPKIVDLNDVVGRLEKLIRQIIGEHIDVRTDFSRPLAPVKVDPGQMEQVVLNLVVNARDAMPRGGALTLETSNVAQGDDGKWRPVAPEAASHVLLSVRDSGTGMDANTLAHLFEPFFTTKEAGRGTGLGLSTVYGIVNQSGGHVTVTSSPGQGAQFRIFLPKAEGSPSSSPTTARYVFARSGGETILVVEDSAAVRKILATVLRHSGYTVLEAASGPEALQEVENHPDRIHLVVSDIIMPGMTGPEMCRRILEKRPSIPIIYVSGYSEEAVSDLGMLGPHAALLEKPCGPALLLDHVRRALDKRGNAAQPARR